MIAEIQANGKPAEIFSDLAGSIMGRPEVKRTRGTLLDPILAKLGRRKATS